MPLSDLDQRLLLHSVADRLNTVADHLPLPDQFTSPPDPGLSEILDDEVRHLARLLGYLAGEHAFRHRAATRYPNRVTTISRRTALAIASAAEPTAAALAALGSAVHHLGRLADLAHQAPSPARARATAATRDALADRMVGARTHLARASKQLRTAADTWTAPILTTPPPAPSTPTTHRPRNRPCT
ncbi:hypothetical protein F9278_15475 [Streptomyces phaeolivaceus]|uniref:CHAD domain-containing protein n=1 Tax=Streptomyces phaeolivaceus TaxID=2653200 RepID=A0A5P8K289_9ACTN|nr:hypothetical protein [Streptomyces phaeolivaceus]QFQ97373.1 hypothetical protein F9278_15475 [Streptomyces phaeolivaceus]